MAALLVWGYSLTCFPDWWLITAYPTTRGLPALARRLTPLDSPQPCGQRPYLQPSVMTPVTLPTIRSSPIGVEHGHGLSEQLPRIPDVGNLLATAAAWWPAQAVG